MPYEKAKAEIVDFSKHNWLTTASLGGDYSSRSDFFAREITPTSQNFGPYGHWPFTQFYCGVFTLAGTYHITINGSPVTIVITPTEEDHVYDCSNYSD